MIKVIGKNNEAVCFVNELDALSGEQLKTLCALAEFSGSRLRVMPDAHAGYGCPIGLTMTITDKVAPALVGVDIGCGMETVKIAERKMDFSALDELIRRHIPFGPKIRPKKHDANENIDLTTLRCAGKVDLTRAERSLGTLGSGNHFIEVDQNEPGELHIVVHSGSRHLGSEVAKHYQEEAVQFCRIKAKLADSEAIAEPRGENNRPDPQDWQDQQNWQARQDRKDRHDRQKKPEDVAVPNKGSNESQNKGSNESPNETALKHLAYLSGALLDDYLHDMKLIQSFAALNRQAMTEVILNGLKLTEIDRFTTIHNYVDLASMILRKGAVSAKKGERLLIPLNMRDGSLICVGKGNDEWNQSAPHGAGRLMSRTEAKQKLSLKEFVSEMRGISSTSVNRKTLDESPMAYKPMNDHFADRPDGRRRRTSEASL